MYPFEKIKVPANAPPLFIALTLDDDFGLIPALLICIKDGRMPEVYQNCIFMLKGGMALE